MATSWKTLYDYFLSKVRDRQLCSIITIEDMLDIMEIYKTDSTNSYFKIINQDVTDKKSPEFYRQDFTADGLTADFTISKWSDGELEISTAPFCEVDGVILQEDVGYTFDINTLTFTLTNTPLEDIEVVCGFDFVGEYNGDFTEEELFIIATGMVYSWTSHKYYNADNLRNRMSTKDFNTFSPANLLEKLGETRDRADRELRRAIISYSFNEFTGFN